MTDDERRNYKREQYRRQKGKIQDEDLVEQRQKWSDKKRSERENQKQSDLEKYNISRALERNKKQIYRVFNNISCEILGFPAGNARAPAGKITPWEKFPLYQIKTNFN